MTLDIPDDLYRAIERAISDPGSPVGIDATKTHVLILHKLVQIEQRLTAIEMAVARPT